MGKESQEPTGVLVLLGKVMKENLAFSSHLFLHLLFHWLASKGVVLKV